uniref:Uncharacterized protein n=2 Tax=Onchocerca TaxID=6281 RepID=A0A8R1U0R2_ONCVO
MTFEQYRYIVKTDAIDEAATKAKEAACSATDLIKRKISTVSLRKTSNLMNQADSANLPSQALLKETQQGVELEKKMMEILMNTKLEIDVQNSVLPKYYPLRRQIWNNILFILSSFHFYKHFIPEISNSFFFSNSKNFRILFSFFFF